MYLHQSYFIKVGAVFLLAKNKATLSYIILWKCLTHSWQIQWILWIGKKEIIEDPKDCFYVTFLKQKRKIFTIFSVPFTLDSLKILPIVGSSIISKPNLSPPSLPHLINLPNLPNLLNLLTQNATKAPSSEGWADSFSAPTWEKWPPIWGYVSKR